jgi:transcriptional regulator with XRE-family HTH domain
MDLKEAMAINLRRQRHARELTQEELADQAGLSSRYLGSIERGAVSASVTVLGRLAQALRVSPCELLSPPQLQKSPRSRSVGKD